jgi:small subunit ribosomal protein S14e
VALSIHESNFL